MATEREPRQDQLRNRAKLLAAAREIFKAAGVEGRIEEVAKRAGVGTTTFYRHFPTKDDLLAALLDELSEGAMHVAADAERKADPWEAFVAVFTQACVLHPTELLLFDQIARIHPSLGEQARAKTVRIVGGVVRRAQEAHRLRGDVTAQDVATLMRMMHGEPDPRRRRKYVTIVLAGLQAR